MRNPNLFSILNNYCFKDIFLKEELLLSEGLKAKVMEEIEIDRSKWSYRKVAAWSGTIGFIVAIVFTLYNFIRFGLSTEHWGGLIGGTIGQFFLIILGFVVCGVIIYTICRFFKKK